MYSAPVISSKTLRAWLFAQAEGKNQNDLAAEWGVKQPTVSRLKTQPDYDIPLNTVAKIAAAFGCRELSEFFRHVETKSVIKKSDLVHEKTPISRGKNSPSMPEALDDEHATSIRPTRSVLRLARRIVKLERALAIADAEGSTSSHEDRREGHRSRVQKSVRRKPRP